MHATSAFVSFVAEAEPRLRRALVARYGRQLGRDATLEALEYGWRHWDRIEAMDNAVGYLYRVGTSSVRPGRPQPTFAVVADQPEPWVEPALESGLDTLSEHQRVAVVLRHSFDWSYDEIAELLDISVSTVRNHLNRGMAKLRSALEVSVDG